jgi:glycerophosphoryl diester phosphodiesterase
VTRARRRAAALLAASAAACTSAPAPAPAPAGPAPHHRAFADAPALARHLDARSPAGPLVSAHRGGPAPGFPDNAIETFERTLGAGPMLIELDVRRTADGALVVLHDDEVSRTTSGRGRVGDLTLAEVRALRLRDASGALTAFRPPSLADALAWAQGRAVLRLDVKAGVAPEHVAAAVVEADALNRVMVGARDAAEAARYRALLPGVALTFWHDPDRDGRLSIPEARALLRDVAPTLGPGPLAVGVGSARDGWDAAVLDTLRARGVRGMVSTFGTLDGLAAAGEWRRYCPLVADGVGIVITDAPGPAARAVRDCPR